MNKNIKNIFLDKLKNKSNKQEAAAGPMAAFGLSGIGPLR